MMHIAFAMAHPDDAEIFCGGAIAAWVAMGARVSIVVATDGGKGGPGPEPDLVRTRAGEAAAGARCLGASVQMLGLPDGGLSDLPGLPGTLRGALSGLGCTLVVTHAPNDYHADHRALSGAVRAAVGFSVPVLWADTLMGTGFQPTHYVDITAHQALKERAIACHASQDPARFVAASQVLGRARSAQCGQDAGFAEAFRFDPVYPFGDIRALLPPAPPLRPVVQRGPA